MLPHYLQLITVLLQLSQGFLGSDSKFWLEELHHLVPGQQGPRQAAGATQGPHPVGHQDRRQTAQL